VLGRVDSRHRAGVSSRFCGAAGMLRRGAPVVTVLSRRLLCLVAAFGFFSVAGVASVGASIQSQGYRDHSSNDNGTRAYLAGTGHNNSTGFQLASVAVDTSASQIEMGELLSTAGISSSCDLGGEAVAAVFVETIVNNGPGQCQFVDAISQFGSGGLFAVAKGTNGWQAFWNSNQVAGPLNMGFVSGTSTVRDEALWTGAQPSENITFGPMGQTAWQFKVGSGSYQTVQISSGDQDPPGTSYWHLGGSPSPFTIYFDGG
jgi:hypothetical protein